ncbi:MAG: hypothetical protein J0I11_18005 [Actinobacteria bacterium]|nr:hypothetical protein [Actinomycetota bacterium]
MMLTECGSTAGFEDDSLVVSPDVDCAASPELCDEGDDADDSEVDGAGELLLSLPLVADEHATIVRDSPNAAAKTPKRTTLDELLVLFMFISMFSLGLIVTIQRPWFGPPTRISPRPPSVLIHANPVEGGNRDS